MRFLIPILFISISLLLMSCNKKPPISEKETRSKVALYAGSYDLLYKMDASSWHKLIKGTHEYTFQDTKKYYLDKYEKEKELIDKLNNRFTIKHVKCIKKQVELMFKETQKKCPKNTSNCLESLQKKQAYQLEQHCLLNPKLMSESKLGNLCKISSDISYLREILQASPQESINLLQERYSREKGSNIPKPFLFRDKITYKSSYAKCVIKGTFLEKYHKEIIKNKDYKNVSCINQYSKKAFELMIKNCPLKKQNCFEEQVKPILKKMKQKCITLKETKNNSAKSNTIKNNSITLTKNEIKERSQHSKIAFYGETYIALFAADPSMVYSILKKSHEDASKDIKEYYIDKYDKIKSRIDKLNDSFTIEHANCIEKQLKLIFSSPKKDCPKNDSKCLEKLGNKHVYRIEQQCFLNPKLMAASNYGKLCKMALDTHYAQQIITASSLKSTNLIQERYSRENNPNKAKSFLIKSSKEKEDYQSLYLSCLLKRSLSKNILKKLIKNGDKKKVNCINQHTQKAFQVMTKNCPQKKQSCFQKETDPLMKKMLQQCIIEPETKKNLENPKKCKALLAYTFYQEFIDEDTPNTIKYLNNFETNKQKQMLSKCLMYSDKLKEVTAKDFNSKQGECIYNLSTTFSKEIEEKCPKKNTKCLKTFNTKVPNQLRSKCIIEAMKKNSPKVFSQCETYQEWQFFKGFNVTDPENRAIILKKMNNPKHYNHWLSKCLMKPLSQRTIKKMADDFFDKKQLDCIRAYRDKTLKLLKKKCSKKDLKCQIKMIPHNALKKQCPIKSK